MSDKRFSNISSIIQDAKKGKMFILVDNTCLKMQCKEYKFYG